MRPVSFFAAAVLLASCGPVQSGALIVEAQAELSAAETGGAPKHAPFEYVAAEEYLHKAREEQSYAEFERAVDFAKKSRDCARVAKAKSDASTRKEMGTSESGVTTRARCRPGPERMKVMLDPDQEPAAKEAEPADPKAAAKKKVQPKKDEPKDPEPDRTPVKPKEEAPLPEGDSEGAE